MLRAAVVCVGVMAALGCSPRTSSGGGGGGSDAGSDAGSGLDAPAVDTGTTADVQASCRTRAECPVPTQECIGQRCVAPTACMSSRQCPGQVCDTARGACVDCVTDPDCLNNGRCDQGSCVAPTRACTSSRQCSDLGLVCDTARMVCVECVGDNDCMAAAPLCGAGGRCVARVCMPGAAQCSGAGVREVCDGRGAGFVAQPCPAGQACQAGACVAPMGVCTPGARRCDPARPQQTQSCDGGGTRWVDGPVCDTTMGMVCTDGACVDRCGAAGRSYLGCEFWPTVTLNSQLDPAFAFAVVLANPQSYPVRATVTGGALTQPRTVSLAPGAIETVTLPWVNELVQFNPASMGCRGNEPGGCASNTPGTSALRRGGAYRVTADGPIAAYQFNPLSFERPGGYYSFTSDASLLLPRTVLGGQYIVSTWPNWQPSTTVSSGGFVSVVGVGAGTTTVTVRASAAIRAGTGVGAIARGATGSFTLQAGDVVQLVGAGAGDLSGTVLEASQPVAVFVGHDCTNVPTDRPACDHLEEQLIPTASWGRDTFVSALRDRGLTTPSVVRIVSQRDGNVLTFEPATVRAPATLNAAQVLELSASQHFRVTGTAPFLVAQYMIGQGPAGGAVAGDPAMVFEVPTQQHRSNYDFLVPSTYQSSFINIVAPMGAQLTMDDQPVRGSMELLSGYAVYTLPIAAGAHRIRSDGPRFGLKVYGIAQYTSYMYPGGLDLSVLGGT
jgi:hypothetical protein